MSNNHSGWLEEDANENVRSVPTTRETISKYVSFLPVFIISLLVCVGAGLLYLHYTSPKYNISESILIKNRLTSPSTSSNAASTDLLSIALDGGSTMNIDNETQMLHSISLIEHVVAKNQLNITYYQSSGFKKTDVYPSMPFHLAEKDSGTCKETIHIKLYDITKEGVSVKVSAEDSTSITLQLKWNQPFTAYGNRFVLSPGNYDENTKYAIDWAPVSQMADDLADDFSVSIPDKKTTIIKLSLLAANITKGQDILNWIVKEYNASNIEEKNTIAQNTIRFIDDRLSGVTNELSGVEENLEGFQGSSHLVDVQAQASQQLENTNDISKNINDIEIQLRVVDILQKYFNDPSAQNKLVPSNLGINDATLISLITRYNELQSKRQREAPQLAANSIVLQDIDNQINDVKTSISENLANIKKNLQLQEAGHRQKDQEYQGFISTLPRKQRELQDIKRKQTITEGLYLYLLQKREETAISFSTSNASTFKQIDPPKADEKPAEPNRMVVKIGSILLGLLIPFGWIRMQEALNDKITGKDEILNATAIPVTGEIGHIGKGFTNGLAVAQSGVAAEQFRNLRTNISLLSNKNNNQVILVTSFGNNEGKSMVSSNLAAVLAMPGKKVALLKFDLRDLPHNSTGDKGLADFLSGNVTSITGLYKQDQLIPTLHVFSPGSVPENPGDLILHASLENLFNSLKKEYDYIVIDTTGVGLVGDPFILGRYSDTVLYVIRIKTSLKDHLYTLNNIAANGKLNNIHIVVNDI